MDQNHTSPPDSTQHQQPSVDSQGRYPHASAPQNQTAATTTTPINPSVHPLMIPQLNPLYWPYFPVNPFAQFPIGPQVPFFMPVCPFPPAAWYYFQQSMMGVPVYVQPVPPSVTLRPSLRKVLFPRPLIQDPALRSSSRSTMIIA
jgi:hypothetical protein